MTASLADRYWARTLYDLDAWPGDPAAARQTAAPLPAKLYGTAPRHPLPTGVPLALGDVRRLSGAFPDRPAATPLDAAGLATLLHYSYGYGRCATSADAGTAAHRLVPSAGRAYPAEVYVWLPGGTDLPAGAHYYDPVHHSLVGIRPDAGRPARDGILAPALGVDLTAAACVVLVTMRFWRIAHRYGAYGYRLATQEAGVVAGSVLGVAAALGWHGHLYHQFLDAPLARWLGLEPDEEAVAVAIPLYRWDGAPPCPQTRTAATSADLSARIAAVDLPYRKPSALDRERCAPFLDLDAAGRIADTADIRRPPPPTPPLAGREPVALPPDPPEPVVDLASALRSRSAGPTWFNPTGEPIAADALWRICRYAVAPHASDACAPGGSIVGLVVAAHRIRNLAPGAYLVRCDGSADRLVSGPVAPRLAAAVPASVPAVNFATVNAVVSIVADPSGAGAWLGARGYRVLNVEAGVVAQRLCVLAGAAGLVARPYNGYRARDAAAAVGLAGTGLVPLFQIAIGGPRVTPTWHLPLGL